MRKLPAVLIAVVLALPAACVKLEQIAPGTDSLLPPVSDVATGAEAKPEKPFTGLRLETKVSGSLMDLDFAPGLEVTACSPGSPADEAGIRVGDRITKANGHPLQSVEQFDAVVVAAGGSKIIVEVDRGGGVNDVALTPALREARASWKTDRYAERAKGRFVVRTVALDDGGFGCEIVELLKGSPFAASGMKVGDRIVALDGGAVTDAQRFARTIGELPFGAEVRIDFVGAAGRKSVDVDLFAPPRRLQALSLPIVFGYDHDADKDEVRFSFIDLWLIALYSYERKVETVRHRFLGFTIVETGVGEIQEADEADSTTSPPAIEPEKKP